MKISLEILQILDAIERQGSFSAAAESLHRVPSALSHAIARLEGELSTRLFQRVGRRAQLNEAGRALLEEGRQLLHAAAELERRVQRIGNGWEAELRIAVDAIIPVDRLYPLLERFFAAGHGTRIQISGEVLGGTWDALATGRADLVVGAPGDMPARSGISSRLLCQESRLIFAISPRHPLAAYPEPIPASELRHHRAVVIADSSRELDSRSTGLIPGQDCLRVTDIRAKASAQMAGLGIGHLPVWLAAPAIASGQLVEKRLAEAHQPLPLHIAWRNRQIGKALQWFLEALAENEVLAALTADL